MKIVTSKDNIKVSSIEEFKCTLFEAIENEPEVLLDFSGMMKIEPSLLQTIILACKISIDKGKILKLKNSSGEIIDLEQILDIDGCNCVG